METPHSPELFDKELCDLVLAIAPRIFAVVQEHEVRPGLKDGCVAAWGLAFDEGPVHVTTADGTGQMVLNSPERALRWFTRGGDEGGVTARLVWLSRSGTAALDHAEAA
ncbi:hypothetical protein [Streptomyces sp. NEAU-YJ-81]|uniref:hypothetical protein n=1 Tax=Streptomyces sp. NEAU-YJ-81 TaxID=2820288 RepID=UPI001ABC1ACD|nr:hypothetical protein [Streptomyces sp. NEAU-YJ-81]MBO3679826.1 hypothetical protein [Streptomyces sp. NEAU-YJ-81]